MKREGAKAGRGAFWIVLGDSVTGDTEPAATTAP